MFGVRDAEIVSLVATSGGFRAAAVRLGLAPSAVSARIAQVERSLGVQLFDRSRQGARLTPEGRRFVEQSSRLITMRDAIAAEVASFSGLSGTLRIGVAEIVADTWVAQLLQHLVEHAPRVRLELTVESSEMLGRRLAEHALDIAVLLRQWAPREAVATEIAALNIGWYAAPELVRGISGFAASGAAELDVEDVSDRAIITFSKQTPPAREVAQIFANSRLPQPIIHGSNTVATIMRLACDGFGVATLPEPMAEPSCKAGRLTRIDFGSAARLSPLAFDMCHLSPSITPFAEILRAGARQLRSEPSTLG
ncbi:MAG: LysR family transcriptional regulator [Neomegalonema sp.]|nr:LysR family transcriptional regulator [Neomegalonema sp.]